MSDDVTIPHNYDTISEISDYIVINQPDQPDGGSHETLNESNIELHKYSYHHDWYSLEELDNCSDSSACTDSGTMPMQNYQDLGYLEEVKAALSVEEELTLRAAEEHLNKRNHLEKKQGSNETIKDSGLDEDFLDELRHVGEAELQNTELDEAVTPTEDGSMTPTASVCVLNNIASDENKQDDLILAVKNDAPHLINDLITKSAPIRIYAALLMSITLGRDHITNMFLDHPKYDSLTEITRRCRLGTMATDPREEGPDVEGEARAELEGEEREEAQESGVDSDITPLMLAALKHQFEIVQRFINKGETIDEPHLVSCKCDDCRQQTDELKVAKSRLSTYQAICSDAYVVLANPDPILRAFELRQKFLGLAVDEKHYKAEYLQLATQCGELSSHILNKVHDGGELNKLLNERNGAGMSSKATLARLKLAIRYEEKLFVAHPICQKMLMSLWVGNLNPAWISDPARGVVFFIILTLIYPFLAIGYWVYPKKMLQQFLQTPLVKFCANIGSYLTFVGILLWMSSTEEVDAGYNLTEDPAMGSLYGEYLGYTPDVEIQDVRVRVHDVRIPTMLLTVWLLGMIWDNLKKIYFEKGKYFSDNMFNLMTFIKLCLYIVSFTLRFYAIIKTKMAISYFSSAQSWKQFSQNSTEAVDQAYWLDADRRTWTTTDVTIISEATFGVASIFSICKITYTFTISERIGPLLLSLAKMLEDVFAFMMIFVFIIAAFCVGFHNLYWYFYAAETKMFETEKSSKFDNVGMVIELFFWSIFGLVEFESDIFNTVVKGQVTSMTGLVLFAVYNWMMVIILINMLIAMMSRSYEVISEFEDVEWKFARTKMFLEYMRKDSTLPTPFNIVPTWKGIYLLHKKFADNWCYVMAGRIPPAKRRRMRQEEAERLALEGHATPAGILQLRSGEAETSLSGPNDGNCGATEKTNGGVFEVGFEPGAGASRVMFGEDVICVEQETPGGHETTKKEKKEKSNMFRRFIKKKPKADIRETDEDEEDSTKSKKSKKKEKKKKKKKSKHLNTEGEETAIEFEGDQEPKPDKKKTKKLKKKKKKSKSEDTEGEDTVDDIDDGEGSPDKKKSKPKKKKKTKKKKGADTDETAESGADVEAAEESDANQQKKKKKKKKKKAKSDTESKKKDGKRKKSKKKSKSKNKLGKGPTEGYKGVIGEVVKRFTHNGGGGDDIDTGDGIEQLQQDLSTLRRDMMRNIFRQDREMAKMSDDVQHVDHDVQKSQDAFTSQHKHLKQENEARVIEMKLNMDELDKHLKRIMDNLSNRLKAMQGSLSDQIQDTQKHVDQHIEHVKSDISDINTGIVKQNESVDQIQGTLNKQVEDVNNMHGTLNNLCSDVDTVQGTLSKSVIMRASSPQVPETVEEEDEEGATGTS